MDKEFKKYAVKGRGLSSMTLDRFERTADAYINPTIIEERKLNVASMDVFSRLMMDRIIFLGVPIDDDVANIIQAQLLFLASTDPAADISIYINTPGGQVTSGLAIYDTMQLVEPDVATICTGMAASMGSVLLCAGAKGKICVVSLMPLLIFANNGPVLFVMFIVASVVAVFAFKYFNQGWQQFITAAIVFAILVVTYIGFRLVGMVGDDPYQAVLSMFVGSMLTVAGYSPQQYGRLRQGARTCLQGSR